MNSTRLRVVFFGTPEFSLASLKRCMEHTELLAVVSQPDRPRGRKLELSPCPVKDLARKAGCQVFDPASLKKDSPQLQQLRDFLSHAKADLFVVVAYGNLLPKWILELPRLACVNVHASLLPRWRGAAPIQRSLEAGESETGVSLQAMVEELDAGDVFLEKRLKVEETDDASSLFVSLSELGGELLEDFIHRLSTGGQLFKAKPQDSSLVTFAPKISKEEGFWDESWSKNQTLNRIRAFSAWPLVRACVQQAEGSDFKDWPGFLLLLRARKSLAGPLIRAGEITVSDKKVYLGHHDGNLEILEIQIPGKSRAEAFPLLQNLLQRSGQKSLKLTKFKSS
jgi:methionyl-tRNA formyltransferase